MTLANLQTLTRELTNTDSTSYDDTFLNFNLTNGAKFLTSEMLDSMTDWNFQGDTATTDIVASTDISKRYYDFPTNFLKLKRVELMADGSNWYRCSYIDIGEITTPLGDETNVTDNFSNTKPYYTIIGNKIMILSGTLTDVTGGIRFYFEKGVIGKDASGADITAFSTATDVPNIPEPFQTGIAYYAAKAWFQKYGQSGRVAEMDADLEKITTRMRMSRKTDEKLYFKPASDLTQYE